MRAIQSKAVMTIMTIKALIALLLLSNNSAQAQMVFAGTGVNPASGIALGGSATFSVSGNQLQLILLNTGAAARVPSDVMTGVFFHWAGVNLTADSATTPALLNLGAAVAGNSLGGGWAYNPSGNGTTGIGVWGASDDFFSATQNVPPLDGIDYGIVSGIAGNANNAVNGGNVLASPSVTFHFTILTPGANLSALTFSGFNYGTSPSDQTIVTVPVPEPTVFAMALVGIAVASKLRRLR